MVVWPPNPRLDDEYNERQEGPERGEGVEELVQVAEGFEVVEKSRKGV